MDNESYLLVMAERIKGDPAIYTANKKYVDKTLLFLDANDRDIKTKLRWLNSLSKLLVLFGKTDMATATRDDIEHLVAKINTSAYAAETKSKDKQVLKALFKHFFGEDLYYPKQIAWIKTVIKRSRLLPETILSEEDVLAMLDTATNPRDQALIALLFDSGIRAGELLSMKRSSIDLNGEPAHIQVFGKTGPRSVPILFAVPYLARYLDSCKHLKPEDPLWWNMSQSHFKGVLQRSGLAIMLKRVAQDAGVSKKVFPHQFRKASASYYSTKMSDAACKNRYGWATNSRVMDRYISLNGKQVDMAFLAANGIKAEAKDESKIKIKLCPKCRLSNPMNQFYCGRCGSPMDITIAMAEEKNKERLNEEIRRSIEDPGRSQKEIEDIVHDYLMEQYKRKKK
jgi:site-specific recombinase XerD/ribosomal protein S27AE